MKKTIYLLAAAAALAFAACERNGSVTEESKSTIGTTEPHDPILEATHLNLSESFFRAENLEQIYRRAVYDFANFEVENASAVTPVRSWQLGQMWDHVLICDDRGIDDVLLLKPGQFAGVDFKTPLQEKLINPEPLDSAKGSRTVIGLHSIWHSESKMRVQAVLGYSNVIGASWTFLYDVDPRGRMFLRKSLNLGCNFPECWIDDPRLYGLPAKNKETEQVVPPNGP